MKKVPVCLRAPRPRPKLTKITVRFYQPMYWAFDDQMADAMLRRDAFLDRVIAGEIASIEEDLAGKAMSPAAHRHVAGCLKKMGGAKAGELWQVSLSVRPETAEALRRVTRQHNLVRDALINRIVMLLRSNDDVLRRLDLPLRVHQAAATGTEDAATSPLKAIEEAQADPFYYLRAACWKTHGCGLYALPLPPQLHGFSAYLPDDQIPSTPAFEARVQEEEAQQQAEDEEWAMVLAAMNDADVSADQPVTR